MGHSMRSKRIRRAAVAFLCLVAGFACRGSAAPLGEATVASVEQMPTTVLASPTAAPTATASVTASTTPPPTPAPSAPTPDRFGIFSFPPQARSWGALRDLGVGWVRLQLPIGEVDRPLVGKLSSVFDEGYGLWLTLYHRDRANVPDVGSFDQSERGGFPAVDADRYRALVQQTVTPLVRRLQALGRPPAAWLVIQVANEVLPSDVAPDQSLRFWHGTSDEYLQALDWTGEALEALDVPIAMGGISSEMMELILENEAQPSARGQAVTAWAERLLRDGHFDWVDVHLYHAVETVPARLAWVRARWSGPLAVTELGGPDVVTGNAYSVAGHAREVEMRVPAALQNGADRVFWTTLVETPAFGDRYNPMALITADWKRRPAFEAYAALIEAFPPGE